MRCLECGGKLKIFDSRKADDSVIRQRYCVSCGKIFYTQEQFFDDQDEGRLQLRIRANTKRRTAYWGKREEEKPRKMQKESFSNSGSTII